MSTDYFANAVYGVSLSEEDAKTLDALAEAGDLPPRADPTDAVVKYRSLRRRLQKKYGAPGSSVLLYSGIEEERPGRCGTPAGVWLLGHGFPALGFGTRASRELASAKWYRGRGKWHHWVTAG